MMKKEAFIKSVTPGQRYCFSDFDRTITINTNSFLLGCNEFGLVPNDEAKRIYSSNMPSDQKLGAISAAISPTVTALTAQKTGIPEGTPLSQEVLEKVGESIGDALLDQHLIYDEALAFFSDYTQKLDGHVTVITASPEPLITGAMRRINERTGHTIPDDKLTVLGSTLGITQAGVTLDDNLRGDGKKDVVVRAKRVGGIKSAEVGAGDRPDESDRFVHQCTHQVRIDAKDAENARQQWSGLLKKVEQGRALEKS
ncbi:MAG: hypothetical protein MRY32_09135 [Rickettsiales bacterium]|nr:hypothetical protein [Rickettsiales bacterium]